MKSIDKSIISYMFIRKTWLNGKKEAPVLHATEAYAHNPS